MSFVKLRKLWDNLHSGFWFFPSILASLSVGLTILCPWLDASFPKLGDWLAGHGYLADVEGCRTILSVTASSAITVAGVVFSITMVVLANMSAQFGPRLLPNFMRQESTKFVLGGFIGTFVYCMISLSMVNKPGEDGNVPEITVLMGLLLGIFCFALLIYFIHRVARFIQAPAILHDVALRLRTNLENYFPPRKEADEDTGRDESSTSDRQLSGFQGSGINLALHGNGYLQLIDFPALVEWAEEKDATIELLKRPGDYIISDDEVLCVRGMKQVSEDDQAKLRESLVLGITRTDTQDVKFAVDQLVEVAVRALSPGIHDPYTAINCIDHLGAALALLSGRLEPARAYRDAQGNPRVSKRNFSFSGILDLAFHPLRQHGKSMPNVALRMMEVLGQLAHRRFPQSFQESIRTHAHLLREDALKIWPQAYDRKDFEERYKQFRNAFAEEAN